MRKVLMHAIDIRRTQGMLVKVDGVWRPGRRGPLYTACGKSRSRVSGMTSPTATVIPEWTTPCPACCVAVSAWNPEELGTGAAAP